MSEFRISILTAALLLGACGGAPERRLEPVAEPPARPVQIATVALLGASGASVPGVVQARERATLVARLAAPVLQLPYQEGDTVVKGAVVARLDASALEARVRSAEADLRLATGDRDRYDALVARQAATPREAEAARVRAEVAQQAVAAAKAELTLTVVRAPFAGKVAARPVQLGDVVVPGQPVLELEGAGGLEVRATVPAELLASLAPGTVVQAEIDGRADPIPATVRVVAPSGDPATHRFEVRAELPATPGLAAGLFARLRIPAAPAAAATAVLAVPTTALFSRGGLTGVFVVADGHARLRWVAAGAAHGELTEVRAGLRAGETVVRDPAGLVDGAPVVVERGAL